MQACIPPPPPPPPCSGANYIHTSHSILGFAPLVSDDLAWLRTTYKRHWNCDYKTWWSRELQGGGLSKVFAWTGSGPDWWWHAAPVFTQINWQQDANAVDATVYGEFHGDPPTGPLPDYHCDTDVWTNVATIGGGQQSWNTYDTACAGNRHATDMHVSNSISSPFPHDDPEDTYTYAYP